MSLVDIIAKARAEAPPAPQEIVIDRKTGQARQAGAALPEGAWLLEQRTKCERSLFAFAYGIMGRTYLTTALHKPVCDYLQRVPAYRKGMLLPREHGKTSIVSHCLPIHILIQPAASNIYFPGEWGSDQRIGMIGETEGRMTDAMRVIESAFENNTKIRALWPHVVWENPRKEAKKWNEKELIVRRRTEWPDPSLRAIGVGGAVTGAHPSVLIKDDLVTIEAANSPVVMDGAIQWHVASRALINKPNALEFIIGTRWAVNDLYEYIQKNDPSVEWMIRSIIEDGKPIWPEAFTAEKIGELHKEFGVMFPLLYMNSAADPELVDFDMEMVRMYDLVGDRIEFEEDERDYAITQKLQAPAPAPPSVVGERITRDFDWQKLYKPGEGLRLRG